MPSNTRKLRKCGGEGKRIDLGSCLNIKIDTDVDLSTISETLTAIGLEVEEVIDPTEGLKPFVIANIEKTEQHPNADKLRVCKVNNGKETIQVVCGAPNAKAGLIGAFAPRFF